MSLTEKGREIIRQINEMSASARQERFSLTAPCPTDGLEGKYVGTVGSPTRVYFVYECANGDMFTFDRETNVGHIIDPTKRNHIRIDNQGVTPNAGEAK